MNKINVLIYPAGEINSVELHDALSTCVNIEVFGASSKERHGAYVFKNYISNVPLIQEKNFLKALNKIIEQNHIDIIFPTHDTVAEFLAKNSSKIKAKIICADRTTSQICRDKEKTFNLFQNEKFCPHLYQNFEFLPVFIKPKKGQGSVGAKLIEAKEDIPPNIKIDDYVICEYLPYEEYSVDCFTDKNRILRAILPRSRKRIMAGVCVAGQDEILTDEIKQIAEKINEKLNFNGLWYFQIKKDVNGKFKLLEISTRCAGTMCLSRAKGVNLALLSVYNALGLDVDILMNKYHLKMDRTLISRYKLDYDYNTVYFDFDDTLIINEKIHLPSIRFLYQCKNLNKKIILITKHEKNLDLTLDKYAISPKLFDKIIQLQKNQNKVEFIHKEKSIFVDNAYQERKKVHEQIGIPVFDVDGLEVIMDWRC